MPPSAIDPSGATRPPWGGVSSAREALQRDAAAVAGRAAPRLAVEARSSAARSPGRTPRAASWAAGPWAARRRGGRSRPDAASSRSEGRSPWRRARRRRPGGRADRPWSTSGAMKPAVPQGMASAQSPAPPGTAMPKSASLTWTRPSPPVGASSRFDGLTSRWTTPEWCAAWSPSAACAMAVHTNHSGRPTPSALRRRRSSSARSTPSTYSWTRYGVSPATPTSRARTTRGLVTYAMRRASAIMRRWRSAGSPTSLFIVLTTTGVASTAWRPSHTSLMPPPPIRPQT